VKALIAIALVLFVFIYAAQGVAVNPFAVWNAAPLALALLLFWLGRTEHKRAVMWGAIGFLVGSMAVSVPGHLAWMLDWGETRTGSSTAGLFLLFLPIFATAAGFAAFLPAWWAGGHASRSGDAGSGP
jgi:hypothetical protein